MLIKGIPELTSYREINEVLTQLLLFIVYLKVVFHWAEFSARSDIFSSKISALNFDLISTSILPKAKTVQKRRNKMSAVEKRLALKVSSQWRKFEFNVFGIIHLNLVFK